jgi:hypothetical protein
MNTLAYKDYLEYIKAEFSKIDFNSLSEEEKAYYAVVNRDLEKSNNMPSRILNAPVIPEKNLNNETTQNFKHIRRKIEKQEQKYWFNELYSFFFVNKEKNFTFVFNFAIILISILASYFLAKSYPINITINSPIITWETITPDTLSNSTENPSPPLIGTGGLEEEGQVDTHVMKIFWKKTTLDITYVTWVSIPILIIILIVYFPAIKWAIAT